MSSIRQVASGFLFGQTDAGGANAANGLAVMGQHLLAAVIFSFVGIAVLALSFWLMEKLTPFSIVKEIEEDQNVALAVIVGAVVLGMSVIISAAILG